jgi:hypothetical protein
MRRAARALLVVVSFAAAPSPGNAQSLLDDETPRDPHAPRLLLPFGLSVSIGGGFAAFIQEAPREVAGTAGAWEARLAIGTRAPFALELAYLGSVQTVDALGLESDALLIGQGAEVALRMNLFDRAWQPYVLAGGAWRRYRVIADANTSDIANADDVVELPLGFGTCFRYEGFLVDGRAVYRTAFGDDLFATRGDLDTLGASLTLGREF